MKKGKMPISDTHALRYEKRVGAETRTSHHRNLIMQRSLAPQELVDLAIDRALAPPLYNWIKQEPVDKRPKKNCQRISTFTSQRQLTHYTHTHTSAIDSVHHLR